ncbi:MAG: NAD-dependent epimerase/dehydratase family protein [Pseudonocardiales bacterium]
MLTPPGCSGRVVITGGAGFVGGAAVTAFASRGNPVTVVDHRAHPAPAVRSIVGDPAVAPDTSSPGPPSCCSG